MLLKARFTTKSTIASLLLFFVITMPSFGAVDKSTLSAQVKTKISFLETLLGSSNAQKLKTHEQGQAYSKVQKLLKQAKNSLNKKEPELAEKFANQGFSTFTKAVKALKSHNNADLNQNAREYKNLHRTVTDRFNHLSSMSTNSLENQQSKLIRVANLLASAEQYANDKQLNKAISHLNDAQELISQALPKIKHSSKKLAAETINKKQPSPAQAKKVVKVAKPVVVAKPKPIIKKTAEKKPVPVTQPNKIKPDTRSPKQKYQAERKRYLRYEKLVGPALEKDKLTETIGLRLIKVADEAKTKADQARGQTIDGNYTRATELMKEATTELIKAIDAAKK